MDVSLTEEEITKTGRSHYIQLALEVPVTVTLAGVADSGVEKLLYDAESGNVWLAGADENYTVFAEIEEEAEAFKVDGELLSYIEGKWEHPPCSTVVELMYYSLTGIDFNE